MGLDNRRQEMKVGIEQAVEYVRNYYRECDGPMPEVINYHGERSLSGIPVCLVRVVDQGREYVWDVWMEDLGDGPFVYGEV
jgi:hypothetical protein